MEATLAVLHHKTKPFLGAAEAPLREAGLELDQRLLFRGDPLPSLDEVDGILSLGGEESVRDIDRYPYLAAEAELMREAVVREVPLLGICLGAQLLAHALGGDVATLERRMVRWTPLEPLPAAEGDPLLGALPPGARGLHWNEDGFSLPAGATELLRSPAGTVEAFRAGERSWGVQFHPELDDEALEGWYEDWHPALAAAGVTEAAARAADREHLPGQGPLSEAIFGGFARVVREHAASLQRHA